MPAKGRPTLEFDLKEVEKLGMLGATAAEVAAWFNCGVRTVERRKAISGVPKTAVSGG